MPYLHHLAPAAAWLVLSAISSLANAADKTSSLPSAADADANVPATTYQATMTFRPAAPDTSTPAQNWKALNQQVASYDSMALTMENAPGPQAAQAEATTPKNGAVPPATPPHFRNHSPVAAPAPGPHAQHMKGGAK